MTDRKPLRHDRSFSTVLPFLLRSIAASKRTSNSPFGKTGTTQRGLEEKIKTRIKRIGTNYLKKMKAIHYSNSSHSINKIMRKYLWKEIISKTGVYWFEIGMKMRHRAGLHAFWEKPAP